MSLPLRSRPEVYLAMETSKKELSSAKIEMTPEVYTMSNRVFREEIHTMKTTQERSEKGARYPENSTSILGEQRDPYPGAKKHKTHVNNIQNTQRQERSAFGRFWSLIKSGGGDIEPKRDRILAPDADGDSNEDKLQPTKTRKENIKSWKTGPENDKKIEPSKRKRLDW